MGITVSAAREIASKAVAASCIDEPKPAIQIVSGAGSCKWFIGLSKKISANKPAAAIHHLTGEPERTCYEWVRGKFDPPSRAIVKLLHSEVGWTVLEYLMRGCKQPWWLLVVEAREFVSAGDAARQEARRQLGLFD